tara:strand:- start:448 stop:681 length:234 start_codon:yes stop_codon:yes gene_type:complete
MNDHEIRKMKEQLTRLDDMMKLLVAKECSCISCLLKGCDCCENKGDVDKLIEKYQATNETYRSEQKWHEETLENLGD